jgi:hypothetical protein
VSNINAHVHTTVRRTFTLDLSREMLLKVLRESGYAGLPDDAQVFVEVPGGGDWSNTDLSIEQRTPIRVRWIEVSEEVE